MKLSDIKFDWTVTEPISSAGTWEDEAITKLTTAQLKENITGLSKGDKIVICSDRHGKPLHTETLRSTTLRGLLSAIYKGTNTMLTYKTKFNVKTRDKYYGVLEYVYGHVAYFSDPQCRVNMITSFEKKGVKPSTLYGDHIYLESVHKKGGYIWVSYGS